MNEKLARFVYRTAARFRGEKTFSLLEEYLSMDRWQRERWLEYQQRCLDDLLVYAAAKIPYYQKLNASVLDRFPVLERRILKEQSAAITNQQLLAGTSVKTTSGSTSEPLTVIKDREAMAREQAATYRGYSWAGIFPGMRQARFWGIPLKSKDRWKNAVRDYLLNRIRYSGFRYSSQVFENYLARLRRHKPAYIYGYTSMVYDFAQFLLEQKIAPGVQSLQAIITTSEVLTQGMRETIENAFGVKVFDEYGCAEVGSIAHECEIGSLHTSAENLIVEVLDSNGSVNREGEGRLIITELHNRVQPLIRYDSGDYGIISLDGCPCGRASPVIRAVHGRAYDTVIGPGGSRYNAAFFSYVFKQVQQGGNQIRQFQVVQRDQMLTFRLVKGQHFSSAIEEGIRKLVEDEFGSYFSCSFEYPEIIEREKSGKLFQLKRLSPV